MVDESIRAPGRLQRANAASAPPKPETAVPPSGSLEEAATMDQESVCSGSAPGESTSCFYYCAIRPLALNQRLSCGETAAPAAGFKLDFLSEADLASLTNGKAYTRKRKEKYFPEESLSLHQSAGRDAEQRRKLDAKPSMVVTAEEYAANGIPFLGNQFPTGPLNWADSPNKITLVDIMPQVGSAYKNSLSVTSSRPEAIETVRLAVERDVAALYRDNGESEEERCSKVHARAGLYLLRELALILQ